MNKREKRLRDLRNKIARKEAQYEAAQRTLAVLYFELPALRRQAKRMADHFLKAGTPVEMVAEVGPDTVTLRPEPMTVQEAVDTLFEAEPGKDPDGADPGEIPTFLRRDVYDAAKEVANNHLKTATPEAKKLVAKEKRAVKEEIKHAELTGQRRKWPKTGRDAFR